jgi:hypothetical protein
MTIRELIAQLEGENPSREVVVSYKGYYSPLSGVELIGDGIALLDVKYEEVTRDDL